MNGEQQSSEQQMKQRAGREAKQNSKQKMAQRVNSETVSKNEAVSEQRKEIARAALYRREGYSSTELSYATLWARASQANQRTKKPLRKAH